MKFTKDKIVGIAGAALAAIGVFLPFVSASIIGYSVSVKYSEGDGIYVLFAIIAALVMLFLIDKWSKAKNTGLGLVGLAAGITLYDGIIGGGKAVKEIKALGGSVNLGIGFYIILVGIVALGVAFFLAKNEKKVVNNGYNPNNNGYNPNGYNYANGNGTTTYQYGNNTNTYSQPSQPVEPSAPVNNGFPQPSAPQSNPWTQPSQPVEPSAPVNNGYTQPSQPVEPSTPVNNGYTQPSQPVEPSAPVNNGFAQPSQPVEPSAPVQPEPTNHFINTNNVEQPASSTSNQSNDASNIFFQ